MGVTSQTGRFGLFAVLLASLAAPVWSDAPRVTLSPAGVQDNAGSVAFRLRGGPDPVTDVSSFPNVTPIPTSGNRYLIYVEPVLILDKSNIVLLTLYVRSSATSSSPGYRYIFSEIPSGRFFDCKSGVGLSVEDGTTTETAFVTLPLHTSDPSIDFVASDDRAPAIPIDATSVTSVDIGLTNKLPDMDVVVTNVAVAMDHDEKWSSAALSPPFDPANPIRISPNHSLNLKVVVTPSFWKSVNNTILPTTESQADDTLRLKLSYASDNAGIPRPFEVTRSLRFVNWPGAVLFGLIGALLGCVVFYFGGKPLADLSLGRILLSRCSSAVILIVIGVFLVANGSKFVLFNLNLDPRQLLAAFLVGGFAGVGLVDLVAFVRSLGKSNAQGGAG
jgi:hypothetical protein